MIFDQKIQLSFHFSIDSEPNSLGFLANSHPKSFAESFVKHGNSISLMAEISVENPGVLGTLNGFRIKPDTGGITQIKIFTKQMGLKMDFNDGRIGNFPTK